MWRARFARCKLADTASAWVPAAPAANAARRGRASHPRYRPDIARVARRGRIAVLRDRLARVVRLDLAAAHLMGLLGRCVDRIAETRAHERARERDAQIGAVRAADGAHAREARGALDAAVVAAGDGQRIGAREHVARIGPRRRRREALVELAQRAARHGDDDARRDGDEAQRGVVAGERAGAPVVEAGSVESVGSHGRSGGVREADAGACAMSASVSGAARMRATSG
ncbi:hypothetical protein BURPS406E_D1074 [Burkholderia pseudomallei 406e]|nr:hypothetical protein BURPS406E_D1074 [Burkholderia pseudomallei 406e]EDO90045.1 hypothetical protein BURPSPAST_T0260 [Burkholderia pseudomallei Pasteur 52237]